MSFINLSDIKKKAGITWEIFNYANQSESHRPTRISPKFSPSNDENIKFFLRFTGSYSWPNKLEYKESDNLFYTVALCMESPIKRYVQVYYKIVMIDWHQQKQFPYEGRAEFFVSSNDSSTPGNQEARHGLEVKFAQAILHRHGSRLSVKFCCEVNLLDGSNVRVIDPEFEKPVIPKIPTIENFGALLKSDVVLVVGKNEFNLHKMVLAARSPVFKAMFDSDLEENKQNNRVIISDIEVEVADLIVPYFYTGEMPSMDKYALELYVASEKYQLEHLKAICEKNLIEALSVETVVKTLLLAETNSATFLKKKSIEFITQNSEQVKTTKGWNELIQSKPELLIELYNDISLKLSSFLTK